MIILVLNLGLKSTRCIAFSTEGQVLAQASLPIRTYVTNELVEQDPRDWRRLSWEVMTEVIGKLGPRADGIRYLTVTTSASCLVAVDTQGEPLRNAILVSDTRARREAGILTRTVEFQKVLLDTAIKASPDMMLPKIMWLARNAPQDFDRTARFLNAGDYLLAELTGRHVTDVNNALKFHYSVSERKYPHALLEVLGIEPGQLPEVHSSGTVVGGLLPSVAGQLGIPNSCEVVLSTYDALAAVTGTGAAEVGDAVDVSGTVTSFRVITSHHLYDPKQRIYVTPYLEKNRWLAGGSNNLGGGIIEWLRQLFFEQETDPYASMETDAQGLPPCPGGLIFLPHLLGERAPVWNPECRGVFFGLNRSHARRHLVKAVFDGVGFSVRHIASVLQESDDPIHRVYASGGLARLDTINQIKADILGVPVLKMENFETTAVGAAIIALIGAGVYPQRRGIPEAFCRIHHTFEPDASRHAMYDEYFNLYLKVYESLQEAYIARARLLAKWQKLGLNELAIAENL